MSMSTDEGSPRAPIGLTEDPSAQEGLTMALARLAKSEQGWVHLVTLTDEELVAYSDDPEEAGPLGEWYSSLTDDQQELAQTAALRTQTANDRFVLTREDEDSDARPLLPPEVLAVLRLRKVGQPVLTATRVLSDDIAWAVYRVHEGVRLRELVTCHGYHEFTILSADVDEAETTLAWAGVSPDSGAAEGVDVTLEVSDLENPAKVPFLEDTTAVTTFIRLFPEGAGPEGDVVMTHVRQGGATFVGRQEGAKVRYVGSSGSELAEDFRSWWARW